MPHRRVCIDHLTLPVVDPDASAAFSRAALVDGLGWREVVVDGNVEFGPAGSEDLRLGRGIASVMPLHVAEGSAARDHADAARPGRSPGGFP